MYIYMVINRCDACGVGQEGASASLDPSWAAVKHCLCRFISVWNSNVGLLSAAEESRPLLMLGMGARGMGPLRAAMEWTPIQAHATANAVSLFYVTESQQSAAYLADWDRWRQAGVSSLHSLEFFHTFYLSIPSSCIPVRSLVQRQGSYRAQPKGRQEQLATSRGKVFHKPQYSEAVED